MANLEHVTKLKEGAEIWNQWRRDNSNLKPNLRGANLSDANLNGVNLEYANLIRADLSSINLSEADLKYANLSDANFSDANLSDANFRYANLDRTNLADANLSGANLEDVDVESANLAGVCFIKTNLTGVNLSGRNLANQDFSKANLTDVILKGVEALGTDFSDAILTGVCIEDWKINSQTNLENVQCDYINLEGTYFKAERKWVFTNRLPRDPNKNFISGEFSKRYQKTLETVELYFDEGVDWQAFLESFNKLIVEFNSDELSINSFENKGKSAFLIKINVPESSDKAEIEKYLNKQYQLAVELKSSTEKSRSPTKVYNDLYEITKLLASKSIEARN